MVRGMTICMTAVVEFLRHFSKSELIGIMNMFVLFLMLMFTAIKRTTTTDNRMIVFTGNLNTFDDCYTKTNIQNFQSCVVSCGKSSSCAICVFINDNCWLCSNKVVSAADRVVRGLHEYPLGIKVFGTNSTNLSVTCERFQFEQGSNTSTEVLTTTIKTPMPTSITTTSPSLCPPGWKYTYRTPNSWCLRLVVNATLHNTYANAKKMCSDLGSQISGLFSMPETDWLKVLARSVLEAYDGTQGVYIDGTRRAACSRSDWNSIASCRLTLGFNFTDPTLTLRGGYAFADGEPNGDYHNGTIQSCIQMVMTKNKVNPYFGKLDDMSCDAGYAVAAVLCGQWAKL